MFPEMAVAHSRAFEPFRPSYPMDDLLKREEEIREAGLAAYKEECKRVRNKKDSIERQRFDNTPYYLDY